MKTSTFTKAIFTCLILSLVGGVPVKAQTATPPPPKLRYELKVFDALTHGGFTAQTTQLVFAVQVINKSDSSVTFTPLPSKITLGNPSNPDADVFTQPFIKINGTRLSPGSSQIIDLQSFDNPMILKNVSTHYSIKAVVNFQAQVSSSPIEPVNNVVKIIPPVQINIPVQIDEAIFSPTITCTPCKVIYQCGSTLGVNSCGACTVTAGTCPAGEACNSSYRCF